MVKTRKLVILAMLVGVGYVLHSIVPGFIFGMKPDMMLTMMFLGILLFKDVKTTILLGIVTGVMTALTTNFPGGQIPNIIDKIFTSVLFLGIVLLTNKIKAERIKSIVLTAIGTLISGYIFLSSALIIGGGLPGGASLSVLFLTVALPASGLNALLMGILYPVVLKLAKKEG